MFIILLLYVLGFNIYMYHIYTVDSHYARIPCPSMRKQRYWGTIMFGKLQAMNTSLKGDISLGTWGESRIGL